MLETPIKVTEWKNPIDHKFRDDLPEKYLGDSQIYINGFKH